MPSMTRPAVTTGPAVPAATVEDLRSRSTFLALMNSLSRPGQIHELPVHLLEAAEDTSAACRLIAEALLDLETTFFTPDANLGNVLAQTGARAASAEQAAYQFYPRLPGDADLRAVAAATTGDYLYPDRAATIVAGCRLGSGQRLRLRGPGIPGTCELLVDGLPAEFWPLRQQRMRYPLGWDLFLTDGRQVVGLPRTTTISLT